MSATEPVVSGRAATPGVGATYKAREVDAELRGARTLERRS
jgi:hypothetical protein